MRGPGNLSMPEMVNLPKTLFLCGCKYTAWGFIFRKKNCKRFYTHICVHIIVFLNKYCIFVSKVAEDIYHNRHFIDATSDENIFRTALDSDMIPIHRVYNVSVLCICQPEKNLGSWRDSRDSGIHGFWLEFTQPRVCFRDAYLHFSFFGLSKVSEMNPHVDECWAESLCRWVLSWIPM